MILHCTVCHHEWEGLEEGGECDWCKEGVGKKIGENWIDLCIKGELEEGVGKKIGENWIDLCIKGEVVSDG